MDGLDAVPEKATRLKGGVKASSSLDHLVLVVRMGRGRTGGSTILDWLVQWARSQGRAVVVADGDRRNPTLAGLYPPGTPGGAIQPPTEELPDVMTWIGDGLSAMATDRVSMVLDLGGGDRVLSEVAQEVPLIDFCEMKGIQSLAIYVCGPEQDDFEHILAIHRAGYFHAARSLLVLNEHLVPRGRTPAGAFDAILARPEIEEMIDTGMLVVIMPRLPCMDHLRASGLTVMEAIANQPGKSGKPLDPLRQFQVVTWHKRMIEAFTKVGALEWLP